MGLVSDRSAVESPTGLGAIDDDMLVDAERFGAACGRALPASMLAFIDLDPAALAGLRDAVEASADGLGRIRHPVVAA